MRIVARLHAALLAELAALSIGCAGAQPAPRSAPAELRAFAESRNAFALELHKKLPAEANLVSSPFSVSTALAMTWDGARGETAQQIEKVLHFAADRDAVMARSSSLLATLTQPSGEAEIRIANRLFAEATYDFEASYLERSKQAYGAPLEAVDFINASSAARLEINGWVADETEQKIRDLIPPTGVDATTRLVLVNAIHFQGDWALPFEKSRTGPEQFFVTANDAKLVPTMQQSGEFRVASGDGVKVLELDYEGAALGMLVVLPIEKHGLGRVEAELSAGKLAGWIGALQPQTVLVSLPRVELNPSQAISLGEVLKALGMPLAFDEERADFTGIADPKNPTDRLHLDQVFHKAFVRIDEKGTEAAAATAVVAAYGTGPPPAPPNEFRADHPFLFLIREKSTGVFLFIGRVVDPEPGSAG